MGIFHLKYILYYISENFFYFEFKNLISGYHIFWRSFKFLQMISKKCDEDYSLQIVHMTSKLPFLVKKGVVYYK